MRGTIAAGHPLTATAGQYALREGGNAIDAAVSAAIASWVVEPVLASPGGGAFALLHCPGGEPLLLDGFAQTPRVQTQEPQRYLVDADFGSSKQGFYLGAGTVATPGKVALLDALHRRGGVLPWAALFAPAIDFARRGFPITRHASQLFTVVRALYLHNESCRALFGRKDDPSQPLAEGDHWSNPLLADFLEALASEGPRFFYAGDIAQCVSALMQAEGGHLRRDDFTHYQVEPRSPLSYPFHDAQLHSNPNPSLGARYSQIGLRAVELGLQTLPLRSDPAYLLSLAALQSRLNAARADRAFAAQRGTGLPPPEDPAWDAWRDTSHPPHSLYGTTHISVIDASGTAIALTASNGSGSALAVPHAGFLLNNMLGESDLLDDPEDATAWPTDTRMASMMSPTLVRTPGGGMLATGSGGSQRIRTTLLQVLLNATHYGLGVTETVLAPRLHLDADAAIHYEVGFLPEQIEALAKFENATALIPHEAENLFFGGAHTVFRSQSGDLSGIGDPRRGGACLSA
jgi:gamma-glutamyltranspeptidase/glutathione hydrolase